jgi:DnaJ family protein C protein 19
MHVFTIIASAVGVATISMAARAALRTATRAKGNMAEAAAAANTAANTSTDSFKAEIPKRFSFFGKKVEEPSGFTPGTFESEMSREEAAEILNVSVTATEEEIKKAHRRLMIDNHPDNGGSTYLSMKINEAKEVMLGGRTGRAARR